MCTFMGCASRKFRTETDGDWQLMQNFLQEFEATTWWSVTKPLKTASGMNWVYPETHFAALSGTSAKYQIQMEATALVSAVAVSALALLMQ